MYTVTIPAGIKEFRVVIEDTVVTDENETLVIDESVPYYQETAEEIPSVTEDKYALLVGIDYKGTANQLNGCINDSIAVSKKLREWGFNDIVDLNDKYDTPESEMPYLTNVLKEIDNLVIKANKACEVLGKADVFFHYSGHGSYQVDTDGDERDGYDEVLCALDGNISDDVLHNRFLAKLDKNCRVFLFTDCCHSGTIMDLAYSMNSSGYVTLTDTKTDIAAKVIMFSGCRDDQTSADAYFDNIAEYRGAATTAFLDTIKRFNDAGFPDKDLDVGNLRYYMHDFLSKQQFTQKPVISMSYEGSFYDKALLFLQE